MARVRERSLVDTILGADVFDAHEAVIVFPSQSLFLRQITADGRAGDSGQV